MKHHLSIESTLHYRILEFNCYIQTAVYKGKGTVGANYGATVVLILDEKVFEIL